VVLEDLRESIATMDARRVRRLAERALDDDVAPEDLVQSALVPGIEAFRGEHDRGQRCVQEMWLVQSISELMRVLDPHLERASDDAQGRVVIGTVEGDAHGLGKDLVKLMLESSGFGVTDLGTDVPADEFARAARERNADVVALSAMLNTTRGRMREVMEALDAGGLREQLTVMIGGASVTERFAASIGTDGYAPDATSSVRLARELMAERRSAHPRLN